jgi:hypothetical protein
MLCVLNNQARPKFTAKVRLVTVIPAVGVKLDPTRCVLNKQARPKFKAKVQKSPL